MANRRNNNRAISPDFDDDRGSSYSDALRHWTKLTPVKGLVGIFELPKSQYYGTSFEEKLTLVGHPEFEFLRYDGGGIETDTEREASSDGGGTGTTSLIRDQYKKIRPIIFVRSDVTIPNAATLSEKDRTEREYITRLMVMLHELGHADDASKSVNYDHKSGRVNVVSAEVYAHRYVCRAARSHNYKWLLRTYLDNLKMMTKSEFPYVSEAAEKACVEVDWPSLWKWTES